MNFSKKTVIYFVAFFLFTLSGIYWADENLKATKPIEKPSVKAPKEVQAKVNKKLQAKSIHTSIKNKRSPKKIIQSASKNKKWVALSFDDGPDNDLTYKILNILEQKKVPATFFVCGMMAKRNQEVLRRIDKAKFTIGNHSWDHPQFTKLGRVQIKSQLERTNETIFEIIGKKPRLFRPPYGATNLQVRKSIREKGYHIIFWNIDTRDWSGESASSIIANVKKNIAPGRIILQHCSGNKQRLLQTVRALPEIINDLRTKGYTFVTIDQLLGISPYQ